MRVVRVKKGGTRAQLGPDGREDSGIEAGAPGRLPHWDAVRAETLGEWSCPAGHDHLLKRVGPGQFASEQPDLSLPTPPFTARRDVDDSGGQAGRPPSRAISPRSRRSSARLKGLWR
jgi:hypothetical protein